MFFLLILPFSLIGQQKRIIITDKAPAPIGAYSQAVKTGQLLFVSGQIALTTDGIMDTASVATETKRVMENIGEILVAAKMGFSNVVKTTIYLTELKNFAQVNEIYAAYFKSGFPARETVEVSSLPGGARVEIAVTAAE